MKRFLPLLCCFFMLSLCQVSAQITEESKSMSLGARNALVLDLPDTKSDFVGKLWKKYLKTYGTKTKKSKGGEIFSDDADIVAIGGANTIDIYAKTESRGDGAELSMWIDLGGSFLASETHQDRYLEGEKFLMRFALFVAKENTKIELDEEEGQLKKLLTLKKKLERDNERYHREIEQAKEAIRKAEANIETNLVEQDDANQQIEIQNGVVDDVKKRLGDL